jgi:hypothetical protein
MLELFRSFAVHQARFHQSFLQAWGPAPADETLDAALEALVYDALWLTKFPLLWSPTFDVKQLDAAHKAWTVGYDRDAALTVASIAAFRPQVDADTLRFVLRLTPSDLEARVALFFGGRASNKPLWQYLAAWFEHGAALRGRLGATSLLETAFL